MKAAGTGGTRQKNGRVPYQTEVENLVSQPSVSGKTSAGVLASVSRKADPSGGLATGTPSIWGRKRINAEIVDDPGGEKVAAQYFKRKTRGPKDPAGRPRNTKGVDHRASELAQSRRFFAKPSGRSLNNTRSKNTTVRNGNAARSTWNDVRKIKGREACRPGEKGVGSRSVATT